MAAAGDFTATINSSLPLWMALVPMLGAFVVYLAANNGWRVGYLAVATGMISVVLGMGLIPHAVSGTVQFSVSAVGSALTFHVDGLGSGMALFAAMGWTLAMLFSIDYSASTHAAGRYWAFMLFTMGSTLGVFLSGDLLTLFIFFELMTFASYALVVHEQNPESMSAGKTFLYMGVFGGLCLLGSIMIIGSVAGVALNRSMIDALLASGYLPLVTVLTLIGFGMKAGMVPLHIWLPKAHPVAPAPASAVLSGVLIKAGAYGLIRMFIVVLGPGAHHHLPETMVNGMVLLGIGLTTLFMGGLMAIFQSNAKRILAYSSISQMGYILTGVGAAAVLGGEGAMGFAGAFYHMINHVVFKAAAFMAVGYVYMVTHDLDITRVSGLWRSMPFAAVAFVAAFGAITGLPGFSGFASKTIIHHALVEAYEETHLLSMLWAERAFVVGSSLTAVYFLRLAGMFFGRERGHHGVSKTYPLANAALVVLTALIVVVGLMPGQVLEGLVYPATKVFEFGDYALKHVHHLEFFVASDIKDVFVSLLLGIAIYVIGWRFRLFSRKFPSWLTVEGLLYVPVVNLGWRVITGAGVKIDRTIDNCYMRLAATTARKTLCFDEEPCADGTPASRIWEPWNVNFGLVVLAGTLVILIGVMVLR